MIDELNKLIELDKPLGAGYYTSYLVMHLKSERASKVYAISEAKDNQCKIFFRTRCNSDYIKVNERLLEEVNKELI